ncbi:MAG: hypothetical protein H7833_13735 [Magnetococcus sp. DMHC-1]
MNLLKTILQNIDLLVAIIAGVIVTILAGTNGISNINYYYVDAGALVAILLSIIGYRVRLITMDKQMRSIARTMDSLTVPKGRDFERIDPPYMVERLASSRQIWIVGIHQHDWLIRNSDTVRGLSLNENSDIRILLVSPSGSAALMTSMRFPDPAPDERTRIQNSLDRVMTIKREAKGRFQVKVIDFLLPYGAILLDPDSSKKACVFVERYTFRYLGGGDKPKNVYMPPSEWFGLYEKEIKNMFDAGTEYGGDPR